MNINWRRTALGELETETGGVIQTGPFGSQLHMSDYSDEGTPVVMPTNIRDMRIDPTDIARVGDEHVDRLVRHQLRPGDILYSRRGDVEKCALVTEHETGWLCGTGCLLVRVQGEHIDTRFLAYQLSTPAKRGWIRQHAVGLTMLNLNTGILREIPIELPDFEEQRRIAGVLGALDDKIESNRQVCSLIDLLATELFCDRFTVHTRGGTSDLMTIGDIGEIVGGGTPSKKVEEYYADSGIAWLTPRDLSKDRSIFRQHGEFDISELGLRKSSARLLPRGTVLFTSRAPIGYIAIASGETSTNQGFKSIVPHSNFGTPFTFYLLKQLTPEIVTSANGSTFKEISKSGLAKVSFKSPSTEAVQAFNATIQPLLDLQEVKEIENCQLSQLRDTLLPELMSGRMRVDEAGCLVSEALDEEVADV